MQVAIITILIFLMSVIGGVIFDCVRSKRSGGDDARKARPKAMRLSRHLPLIFLNIATLCVFALVGLTYFHHIFDISLPSTTVFASQFLMVLFLDDLVFYVWHRYLHLNPYLMKRVHSVHHRARIPYPIEFIYAHPVEWTIGGSGIAIAFVLITLIHGSVNAYVLWIYTAYRALREVHSHSNTILKSDEKARLVCSAQHHALHHVRLRGNYASTFTLWDRIFGTLVKN